MKNRVLVGLFGAAVLVPGIVAAAPPAHVAAPVTHVTTPITHVGSPATSRVIPPVTSSHGRIPTHPMHLATAIPSKAPCLHSGCPPQPNPTVYSEEELTSPLR